MGDLEEKSLVITNWHFYFIKGLSGVFVLVLVIAALTPRQCVLRVTRS